MVVLVHVPRPQLGKKLFHRLVLGSFHQLADGWGVALPDGGIPVTRETHKERPQKFRGVWLEQLMADVSQMSDDVSGRSFGGQADTSFFIKNGLVTNPIRFWWRCLSKNFCTKINKMVFLNQSAAYTVYRPVYSGVMPRSTIKWFFIKYVKYVLIELVAIPCFD